MVYGPSVNNAPPVLSTPTAGSIAETDNSSDTTTSGLSGTLTASDANSGDTLTYGITGGSVDNGVSTLAGSYGSLALNTSSGVYTYIPNNSSIESLCAGAINDSFCVSVTDGSDTTTAPTSSTSRVPMTPPRSQATPPAPAQKMPAVTGTLSATDAEGLTDGTYFSIETGNTPSNGSASIDPASGEWSYTPNTNFNGNDSFTVTITDDDGHTTTQAISLTVTAVDDSAVVSSGALAPAQKTPPSQAPSQPLTLKVSPMAPSSRSLPSQATAQRP